MKAERRHELQKNDLSAGLSDLPTLLRLHSNKILIGVIVACLIVMLVRYRNSQSAQASYNARSSLQSARQAMNQLRGAEQTSEPAGRAKLRRDFYAQVNATLDTVLDNASGAGDASIRAEAWVTRGDLNWMLANFPALPGAATRPELALPKLPTDYLDEAERAYHAVTKDYADQGVSKATALLGLAAIAENRGDWSAATDAYSKLTSDPASDKTFKDIARQRLALLPSIQMPVFVGSFSSTQPATTQSTTTNATTEPQ